MTDLKYAFLSHGGLEGVRVISLNTITETPDESQAIAGIIMLNNFEFSFAYSVTCGRDYCIDRGKTIKLEKPSCSK